MRLLLISSMVLLAAAAPPKKQAPQGPAASRLPTFSFMSHSPSLVEASPVGPDGKLCQQTPKSVPGDVTCTTFDAVLAGEDIRGWITLNYYQGHLYYVFGEGGAAHYPTILRAFTAKYGEPKITTEPWQNKAGATFDNTIVTWRFRDGVLHLDEMGLERDDFSFQFDAKSYRPPEPATKLDF